MTKTLIKFCGITSIDDYKFINDQIDVNYIGMIFSLKSPRCLTIKNANQILNSSVKNKSIVGVFMDQSENEIWDIIKNIDLDILQFHGDESVDYCKRFNKPFIKTLHVNNKLLNFNSTYENNTDYFLIDTSINGDQGGTGTKFDWNLMSDDSNISRIIENHSCFIAGGLDVNNISHLISQYKPYGIDVSSGLESSVGKKDHLLMKKFLENVRISEKENYEKN